MISVYGIFGGVPDDVAPLMYTDGSVLYAAGRSMEEIRCKLQGAPNAIGA